MTLPDTAAEASDPRRREQRARLRWLEEEQARLAAIARAEQTLEERAGAVMRAAHGRMLTRPLLAAPQSVVQSWLDAHPNPWLVELDNAPDELRFTRAEVSLGEVLDGLAENDPWLPRLERADEDFGRPLGDTLRLRRWSRVLVDMHFPDRDPAERSDLTGRYFARVKALYWGGGA